MLAYFKKKWANGPKLRNLSHCQGGTAAIEMAFMLPIFIGLTTGGIEVTHYSNARMKVAQLALHAADHASRMGTSTVLQNLPVTDADVKDVMSGTILQGESIALNDQGRVIISSLQVNAQGGQWIAWQRCLGSKTNLDSSYGDEGTGATGTSFAGMGYNGEEVKARADEAVMFAEVRYEYQSIFNIYDEFVGRNDISEIAAFNVRDDRDLTRLYHTSGINGLTC